MAEAATQSPPSLSEEYSLPAEVKPAESKPVEVEKVETPASAAAEEATPEKTEEAPAAVVESAEAPSAPAGESNDAPADAVQESTEESAPAAEENSESPEPEESGAEEAGAEAPEIKLETAPADFRFPTTNQTRHCFTRYIEYHRCVAAKGEGAPECDKFAKYYRSLCPGEWIDRWNEQRENGAFPGPL
uniref:Uncharacterized protein n=1 Tax=Opuntia streptacantha TaxID=393608 RepID=A0A7C9E4M7_OPUST